MPNPGEEQFKTATTEQWADYNAAMAGLFAERDWHPVDSPERDAVVKMIMRLWEAEG